MAMKTIAANPIPIMKVRIQLAGRFSPMSANLSPRNRTNPQATHIAKIASAFASGTGWRSPRRVTVRRLGRERGSELLELRIVPQRIEHGIEPEQRRSEGRPLGEYASVRY